MGEYLISCVRKSERNAAGHKHIVGVGIGNQQYSVAKIYEYLDQGHEFRTASPSSGQLAVVAKFECCGGVRTLRTHADSQWNDNLDNLPKCP